MILCRILGVSTSGYYAWRSRGPSSRDIANAELTTTIIEIHQASRGRYGVPRVHAELVMGRGIRCSRNRVARLMIKAGLQGVHRRRLHGITHRDRSTEPSPDLVKRQFTSERPDQLWVADMTEPPTAEGKVYLAAVIDAFSRKVVGWSMGTVGDALDNAAAESFFATLQTELLDRHTWSTRRGLMSAIFDYVEAFYNRHRRHSTLKYYSPEEFETRWQASKQTSEQSVA